MVPAPNTAIVLIASIDIRSPEKAHKEKHSERPRSSCRQEAQEAKSV
jgi:hypothetical protein